MSDPAVLERRYRRLLAWYPQPFRREHEEEMLAVLMAGARQGQRRPGVAESANLIMSALGMWLRRRGPGASNQRVAEALALFSVVAPLFLLFAAMFPYAIQLVFAHPQNLLRRPTPGHLILLFLLPLLLACGVVLTGTMPRRLRVLFSPDPPSAPI